MAWTSPKVIEIRVGLEINSYACAELQAALDSAIPVSGDMTRGYRRVRVSRKRS